MPKIAVVITSYNCNEALPNTFTSISRQKVNFDYEVCYLDDCSYHDPKPIYEKFLRVPHKKGWRLKHHIGTYAEPFRFPNHPNMKSSFALAMDMLSPDVEIVLLNHGDMLMAYDDMFQKMVNKVKHKSPIYPDAHTLTTPQNLYELDWKVEIERIKTHIESEEKTGWGLYQGAARFKTNGMAAVCACFLREDLKELEYEKNTSEFFMGAKLKYHNYVVEQQDRSELLAIHQKHKARASIHFTDPGQSLNWKVTDPEREEY